MSTEWKSGDKAVGDSGGPVFYLRDRFYSGHMGETTMWSVAVSPYDPIGGSLPQACLRRPIPTLEENQARLRQEQAEACKRLGYGMAETWRYESAAKSQNFTDDAKQAIELILAESTKP